MAEATLERIIEEIKTLSPDEQRRLRESLNTSQKAAEETEKREALYQALHAVGLVIRRRQRRTTDIPNRPLISMQGKPVSETIIEERR